MTSSRPETLDEYILRSRYQEFERANKIASAWSSGPPGPSHNHVINPFVKINPVVKAAFGAVERGSTVSRPDRNKYDVHETFDAVLETLNAAIENIAHDLTAPGVSGIGRGGLRSIRASFDSLVDVRNEFMLQEYEFATARPEPVPEVTPDADGIIHDKCGNVVGRVATGSQE